METKEKSDSEKDKLIWKEAKKRVEFKNHFITYLAVNTFFWLIWAFTDMRTNENGIPWPVFPAIGWGFGLFWHYASTYLMGNKVNQVEREYNKLKKKNES